MSIFPKEVNILLGKTAYNQMQRESWGAYDIFRQVILKNREQLEQGQGLRIERPFYEGFLQHLLMFDDVFEELTTASEANETAIMILDHIKSQITGKHYHNLMDRAKGSSSTVWVKKALVQRILARRAEKGSMEALIKRHFIERQFEEIGDNFVFQFKTDDDFAIMRDTLAYAAMVEALQTSNKTTTRVIGDRLAKENYLRVMLAHHILDARDGFRIQGEVLEKVRQVLETLDKDQNGLLSLHKAGEEIGVDVSAHEYPELWMKLRSYDNNGDGYLTAAEQIRLKEAIAGLIQRGIEFKQQKKGYISFEEVERILSKELPLAK